MKKLAKKIFVNVGKTDIKNGEPNSSRACPIACALLRRGISRVQADYSTIAGRFNGKRLEVKTPKKAEKFMRNFDRIGGWAVKPIRFSISL
jgi:hypothetical protein